MLGNLTWLLKQIEDKLSYEVASVRPEIPLQKFLYKRNFIPLFLYSRYSFVENF